MIIQGSNVPLTIQFDASVAEMPKLVVTLWNDSGIKKLVKKWEKSDMTISEDTAICPMSEKETASLPSRSLIVEAKGLDEDGETVFWDAAEIDVTARRDSVIKLTGVQ